MPQLNVLYFNLPLSFTDMLVTIIHTDELLTWKSIKKIRNSLLSPEYAKV